MKSSISWAVVGVDWSDEVAGNDPGALEDYTVDWGKLKDLSLMIFNRLNTLLGDLKVKLDQTQPEFSISSQNASLRLHNKNGVTYKHSRQDGLPRLTQLNTIERPGGSIGRTHAVHSSQALPKQSGQWNG